MNQEAIKIVGNFDELLNLKYGKIGTEKRANFEEKAQKFVEVNLKKPLIEIN